jgi:hypothetical protein
MLIPIEAIRAASRTGYNCIARLFTSARLGERAGAGSTQARKL